MGVLDYGWMILFIQSILCDIGIPQEAASILYEDNNACIAMAMAQKPTPLTRHMDIKYHVLIDWIECNLLQLEHIDTSLNMADHFTKQLGSTLFHQHVDYILGKVPPTYSSIFKGFPKFISDGITKLQIPPTLTCPDPLTADPLTAIHQPIAAAAATLRATW